MSHASPFWEDQVMKETNEVLFRRYRGLIGYVASRYAACSSMLDQEDLFQDGCLMMLEFFRGRADTQDVLVHNTFKKSLFFSMSRRTKRSVRKARHRVTLSHIHIDRMFAAVDTCVMMRMYVREFVAEFRRLLKGTELTAFEILLESVPNDGSRADVVRRIQDASGVSKTMAYRQIKKIRDMAERIWLRAA